MRKIYRSTGTGNEFILRLAEAETHTQTRGGSMVWWVDACMIIVRSIPTPAKEILLRVWLFFLFFSITTTGEGRLRTASAAEQHKKITLE